MHRAQSAHADASDAARSHVYYNGLVAEATDPVEKADYQRRVDGADDNTTAALAVISRSQSDIADAVGTWDRAARDAADQIHEITSHDGLNDSWWDDWGAKLVAAVADVADLISTVAGVLAIIVAFIPVVGTSMKHLISRGTLANVPQRVMGRISFEEFTRTRSRTTSMESWKRRCLVSLLGTCGVRAQRIGIRTRVHWS